MTWPRMAWLKTGTRKKQTHWELLEREIMSWKKDEKGENMGKTMKQDCSHILVSTLDSE